MPNYPRELDQAITASTLLYERLDAIKGGRATPGQMIGYETAGLRQLAADAKANGLAVIGYLMGGDAEVQGWMQDAITAHRARNQAFPADLPAAMQTAETAGTAFWPIFAAAVNAGTFDITATADEAGYTTVSAAAGTDIQAALAGPELDAFHAAMAVIAGRA